MLLKAFIYGAEASNVSRFKGSVQDIKDNHMVGGNLFSTIESNYGDVKMLDVNYFKNHEVDDELIIMMLDDIAAGAYSYRPSFEFVFNALRHGFKDKRHVTKLWVDEMAKRKSLCITMFDAATYIDYDVTNKSIADEIRHRIDVGGKVEAKKWMDLINSRGSRCKLVPESMLNNEMYKWFKMNQCDIFYCIPVELQTQFMVEEHLKSMSQRENIEVDLAAMERFNLVNDENLIQLLKHCSSYKIMGSKKMDKILKNFRFSYDTYAFICNMDSSMIRHVPEDIVHSLISENWRLISSINYRDMPIDQRYQLKMAALRNFDLEFNRSYL